MCIGKVKNLYDTLLRGRKRYRSGESRDHNHFVAFVWMGGYSTICNMLSELIFLADLLDVLQY